MVAATACFSPDYEVARSRFCSSARARGARMESYPVGREGLTIDVALLGDERPSSVVVVSSGLHGVEGFLGSAIQAALLEGDLVRWRPPPGAAIVLLHALDPYGFARLRRVDEDNVDLNRNFLPRDEAFRGSPALYAELDPWLNIRRPPWSPYTFLPWALLTILRRGMPALKDAVAGGQYDFPLGLFFGGHGPSPTRKLLAENLPRWIGDADPVLHVDVHTGLGRWATCKLLLDEQLASHAGRLSAIFGADAVEVCEPSGTAYHSRGDLGTWCQTRLFPDRSYDAVCAEFGTYSPLRVLAALRAENQAHHWGPPDAPATRRAKRRLAEVFTPADPRWREATLRTGLAIVRRAIEACFVSQVRGRPSDEDSRECVPV